MMTQHEIRSFALQAVFLMNSDDKMTAEQAILQVQQARDLTEEVPGYAKIIIEGVKLNNDVLNEKIAAHLKKGWQITRLSRIDLSIMQVALFEILYSESIPAVSAINEALNLTHEFSDDRSKGFINGVLSNFIEK